jgi:hypothetical protein
MAISSKNGARKLRAFRFDLRPHCRPSAGKLSCFQYKSYKKSGRQELNLRPLGPEKPVPKPEKCSFSRAFSSFYPSEQLLQELLRHINNSREIAVFLEAECAKNGKYRFGFRAVCHGGYIDSGVISCYNIGRSRGAGSPHPEGI